MLVVPSASPRMSSLLRGQTQACTASSVRFAWEGIVGRRRVLTAGPVANMNLTRLNAESGLHEGTLSPTRADLNAHTVTRKQQRRTGSLEIV